MKTMQLILSPYRSIKHKINQLPWLKSFKQKMKEAEYEERFAGNCYGCFRGVFETFEEAILSAPKTKNVGYDDTQLAQWYINNLKQKSKTYGCSPPRIYDYPMLFWLKDIVKEGTTIFDLGGNIGIHFYAYKKYLNYPSNLTWTVCDFPAITQAAEDYAREINEFQIKFTNNFEEADNVNIFISSGSIQYLKSYEESFLKLSNKPKHLLINRFPLYEGKKFVTLQNGGEVFYPQYVFNRKEFIDSFSQMGYHLIDEWEDPMGSCKIPFYPEYSVPCYSGLYFKLAN